MYHNVLMWRNKRKMEIKAENPNFCLTLGNWDEKTHEELHVDLCVGVCCCWGEQVNWCLFGAEAQLIKVWLRVEEPRRPSPRRPPREKGCGALAAAAAARAACAARRRQRPSGTLFAHNRKKTTQAQAAAEPGGRNRREKIARAGLLSVRRE
jgi:hypothetical protein